MQEIWKDIKGFENKYQVSNLGNIKSLSRTLPTNNQYGNKSKRNVKTILLKPYPRNCKATNHLVVTLYKNKQKKLYWVHRLVAEAFIPNPQNYPYINHKDGNPENNCVNNLEWCTIQMNTQHAYDLGLEKPSKTRKVKQYTLNKEYIKTWDTINEAEITLNLHHIGDVCRGIRNRAGNYLWTFAD